MSIRVCGQQLPGTHRVQEFLLRGQPFNDLSGGSRGNVQNEFIFSGEPLPYKKISPCKASKNFFFPWRGLSKFLFFLESASQFFFPEAGSSKFFLESAVATTLATRTVNSGKRGPIIKRVALPGFPEQPSQQI